ncbi:MAG: YicC/YloC family endoribonuclease [bacterium]
MRSMTGYGTGDATSADMTVTVELRSVNHRFLDVALKLPAVLMPLESEIRNYLKENVARGRITCAATLSSFHTATPVVLDEERLKQGINLLKAAADELAKAGGQKGKPTLDHLLAIPDLFRTEESELEADDVRDALRSALATAVKTLLVMKEQEGKELAAELDQRLGRLRGHLDEVVKLVPQAAEEALARLRARLDQLVEDNIDPQRLAQEAAILADRANINEECERLASHIEQFVQTLADGGQVAKRLNFLLQEMHREVNTMGSKTNLMAITQIVIDMKDEVESMREQVQNLE